MSDSFVAVVDSRRESSAAVVRDSYSGLVLRLGICGCGQVSEHHVRALGPLIMRGRVTVRALVDPKTERREAIQSLLASEAAHPPRAVEYDRLSDVLESVESQLEELQCTVASQHEMLSKRVDDIGSQLARVLDALEKRPPPAQEPQTPQGATQVCV